MVFAEFRELETERLRLRRLRREDSRDYFQRLGSSEAVTRYMLFSPHRDVSESEASVEKTLRRYEAGSCYRWCIADKRDDRLLGVIDLLRLDPRTDTCSFAYMLAEDCWGRGYGTEALKAALDFAFRDIQVGAVIADHMAENAASGAVMRKAGMRYLHTQQGKYEKNGMVHDAPVYCVTRMEFLGENS